MPRPDSVLNEDLLRWGEIIDHDSQLDQSLANNPIIREICYAGQYLTDQLHQLNCPDHLIGQMLYCAGQMCFGRPDPWEVHQEILEKFINGSLEFELEEFN